MKPAIELSPAQAERLRHEAERLGIAPEDLARAALADLLARRLALPFRWWRRTGARARSASFDAPNPGIQRRATERPVRCKAGLGGAAGFDAPPALPS